MDNFKQKFIEEANDHINELEKALLELDHDKENKEVVERIFRAMHSLKGGGAMFGFQKISDFTHHLETAYDEIRSGKATVDSDILSVTLKSVDHIKDLLDLDENLDEEQLEIHETLNKEIQSIISKISVNKNSKQANTAEQSKGSSSEATYYIRFIPNENIFDNGTNPLYLLDELVEMGDCLAFPHTQNLPKINELSPLKCYIYWEVFIATKQSINDISDVFIFVEDDCELEIIQLSSQNMVKNKKFSGYIKDLGQTGNDIDLDELQAFVKNLEKSVSVKVKKAIDDRSNLTTRDSTISSIRVSSEKLDHLMNLVSELVTTQARLSLFAENTNNTELTNIAENVQKLSRQLRDNAFSIVLIPVENMITRFQRLVRDLSIELNKEVDFIAEGTETELDKTIIENLTDPLLHILRNSIDHGIEDAKVREKKGKNPRGKILLKAFYSGANVHIQIIDDGGGIDPEMIQKKAINKGIISPDVNLSKKEILDLIFLPGFSTAKNVTDVSGRGVGMDVVKRKIASIRGEVEVNSEIDEGTTITIKLPLTLSIIDGLLVKIVDDFYVIPLSVVDKIYAIKHKEISGKFNNTVILDGEQISFFNLRNEFGLPEYENEDEQIVVVKYDDKQIGLTVDNVVGEYQAVLKPLGKHYKNQEVISGATILGDGTIALVMDTNKAIKYFSKSVSLTTEE